MCVHVDAAQMCLDSVLIYCAVFERRLPVLVSVCVHVLSCVCVRQREREIEGGEGLVRSH